MGRVDGVRSWQAALSSALRAAMKRRDPVAVAALRSLSARVANAEALPVDSRPRAGAVESAAVGVGAADVERRMLSRADVDALVAAELAELEHGAAHLAGAGRPEESDALRARVAVLRRFVADHRVGSDTPGPPTK